jgi:hypothetical protein
MAVYGPVRHQKNIIWTSEASVHKYFFGDGPVHILPYDPQCHELFAICLIEKIYQTYITSPCKVLLKIFNDSTTSRLILLVFVLER